MDEGVDCTAGLNGLVWFDIAEGESALGEEKEECPSSLDLGMRPRRLRLGI